MGKGERKGQMGVIVGIMQTTLDNHFSQVSDRYVLKVDEQDATYSPYLLVSKDCLKTAISYVKVTSRPTSTEKRLEDVDNILTGRKMPLPMDSAPVFEKCDSASYPHPRKRVCHQMKFNNSLY